MAKSPQQNPKTQLALFQEGPSAPIWEGLSEATHVEVVQLLARLLMTAGADKGSHGIDDRETQQ